ncbi:MAG: FmdB family transcriptional regulator [Dehalococcoidales bacterium]|nr:FmdB family transcriptional regulator [Dehalococcoidales bacterium]
MPTYDYECTSCSNKFELRRSFSDDSEVFCPKCNASAIRVFSPVPIIFKGSGFYVTDHRGKNGSSAPVTESTETKATASADSSSAASGKES